MLMLMFLILILAIFGYTWFRFRQRVYIHTSLNQPLIKKYPLQHKEITYKTEDGETISAWYIPISIPKAIVILIPGFTDKNGGKPLMFPHADYLVKNGYSVLLLDLRSIGASSGNKIYLGIKEWKDVVAGYNYLKALPENKNKKIGYFGISMGAATAIIALGNTQKGDFIIASVPFSSYDKQFEDELKKSHLWTPIFFPFLKIVASIEFGINYNQYDPIKMVSKIYKPILVFAARNDMDIDYHQTESIYKLANQPKEYWLAETQHDIFDENPSVFEKKVLNFLENLNK